MDFYSRPSVLRLQRNVYHSPFRHATGRRLVDAFYDAETRLYGTHLPREYMLRIIRRYIRLRNTNSPLLERRPPPVAIPARPVVVISDPDRFRTMYPTVGYHPFHPLHYSSHSAATRADVRSYWGRDPYFRRFVARLRRPRGY